jgi:hypothetical protein
MTAPALRCPHRSVDLVEMKAVRNRRLRHYIEQSRSPIYDAA